MLLVLGQTVQELISKISRKKRYMKTSPTLICLAGWRPTNTMNLTRNSI